MKIHDSVTARAHFRDRQIKMFRSPCFTTSNNGVVSYALIRKAIAMW